jgi:hypothetical protein
VCVCVRLVVYLGVGQNLRPRPRRDLTFVGKTVVHIKLLRKSRKANWVGREK